jgi:hypothetical protein
MPRLAIHSAPAIAPAVVAGSPVTATDKTDLAAAITAAGAGASFADVRAKLTTAAKRTRFTDGMIHQAALELGGYTVRPAAEA